MPLAAVNEMQVHALPMGVQFMPAGAKLPPPRPISLPPPACSSFPPSSHQLIDPAPTSQSQTAATSNEVATSLLSLSQCSAGPASGSAQA